MASGLQRRSPDAQRAAAFQDQLDRGVAAGRFRVVQVRADVASHATDALASALKTSADSIDLALFAAVKKTAQDLGVEWTNIESADRAGPDGPDWPLLLELVRQAMDRVVDDLLKRREQTLVLAWPGTLARYGLSGALSRIVNEAERGDAPAILLVVPSHADGAAPIINGLERLDPRHPRSKDCARWQLSLDVRLVDPASERASSRVGSKRPA